MGDERSKMFTFLYEGFALLLTCALMLTLYVFGTLGLIGLFKRLKMKWMFIPPPENLELFEKFVVFMYWVFVGCGCEAFYIIVGFHQPWQVVLLKVLPVPAIFLFVAVFYISYAKLGVDCSRLDRLVRRED
jgi:hypothetical protein